MTSVALTPPSLQTDRLTLRPPSQADTSAMLAFLGSDRAVFYGGPMAADAAWQKYASYVGQWALRGYGMFAVVLRDSDETVALVGPYHPEHFPEPEMSWLITNPAFEGKGYAREACQAVLAYLFDDLGWSDVVSYIDTDNTASLALASRLGATLEEGTNAPIKNCQAFRHSAREVSQ